MKIPKGYKELKLEEILTLGDKYSFENSHYGWTIVHSENSYASEKETHGNNLIVIRKITKTRNDRKENQLENWK